MFRWLIASLLLTGTASAQHGAEGRITYNGDVVPILEKNCVGCHRPGQIAPMSFLTYETTRPWAPQIKAVVVAKKMPPAVTSPHYIMCIHHVNTSSVRLGRSGANRIETRGGLEPSGGVAVRRVAASSTRRCARARP